MPFIPALGQIQPPIKWKQGLLLGGKRLGACLKLTTHIRLILMLTMSGPTPQPSHVPFRRIHKYHAVPLPCRSAKGLDCVFPI
jgi:hypothetical protein